MLRSCEFGDERRGGLADLASAHGANDRGRDKELGGAVGRNFPTDTTHLVRIGGGSDWAAWQVDCWWDRWLAGTRTDCSEDIGDSRLSLSGVFAGALAVRQIFASARIGRSHPARDVSISLWEPWTVANRPRADRPGSQRRMRFG